jgi:hypothetical protein
MRELMLDIFRWLHNTPYPIAEADKKKAEFWRRLWDEMTDDERKEFKRAE